MLAGMREIDPGADVAPLDCSKVSKDDVGNPVAAGSVALLLADRVGSTHLEVVAANQNKACRGGSWGRWLKRPRGH